MDGAPGADGWHPEGRVSIDQALVAFTVTLPGQQKEGNIQGKLAPGYWADLIVLDQDPYKCSTDDLPGIQPQGTMVAGKWVFREF